MGYAAPENASHGPNVAKSQKAKSDSKIRMVGCCYRAIATPSDTASRATTPRLSAKDRLAAPPCESKRLPPPSPTSPAPDEGEAVEEVDDDTGAIVPSAFPDGVGVPVARMRPFSVVFSPPSAVELDNGTGTTLMELVRMSVVRAPLCTPLGPYDMGWSMAAVLPSLVTVACSVVSNVEGSLVVLGAALVVVDEW
jgi:hypothetical protein